MLPALLVITWSRHTASIVNMKQLLTCTCAFRIYALNDPRMLRAFGGVSDLRVEPSRLYQSFDIKL